ncbi:hypothetical protein [Streptomyces sp. NPDC005283]|uniref:hypothetical protein n=1 Tax=Streptomyces sp. NPDC005283 TaxID=3156871 RepID=UPI003454D737
MTAEERNARLCAHARGTAVCPHRNLNTPTAGRIRAIHARSAAQPTRGSPKSQRQPTAWALRRVLLDVAASLDSG